MANCGCKLGNVDIACIVLYNRGAVQKLNPDSINLAGLVFHTDAKIADKITGGLKRHR